MGLSVHVHRKLHVVGRTSQALKTAQRSENRAPTNPRATTRRKRNLPSPSKRKDAKLRFKGVLIDLGDTLAYIDHAKNLKYQAALASTLKKHGHATRPETLTSVLADLYHTSTKGELQTSQKFWRLMLTKLSIPEQPELIDALQDVRSKHGDNLLTLYDKVPETLTRLEEKYQLALVSNCAPGTDAAIRFLGLADFFPCIILSYEIGVRKPDRRMYLEALKCLGLEADSCVFVADEISDLEGAREVGLKTILVRQGRNTFADAKDVNFQPDYQVNQVSEIAEVL
jgi:HAD superfamily hydrolase (TIGR01509 family)